MWELFHTGGFVMYPLLLCSIVLWIVILERVWMFQRISKHQHSFHLEAVNRVLRKDFKELTSLCAQNAYLPSSQVIVTALDRLASAEESLKKTWIQAVERKRQELNHGLKKRLWLLGTIANSAPFIGLFGTVVGILRSFHSIAQAGTGGFAVVAGGISESLVATAAGILVAVVASLSFNALQTRWSQIVFRLKLETEELVEVLQGRTEA